MKRLFMAMTVMMVSFTASATTFTDMGQDHWAGKAVDGIVKYGVTQGYPDGTFRGTKTINRYELSIFLYNLIETVEKRLAEVQEAGASEKVIEELKEEINSLKAQLAMVKFPKKEEGAAWQTSFSYGARARVANVFATEQTSQKLYENRLTAEANKKIADNTSISLKFDSHWINPDTGSELLSGVNSETGKDQLANIDAEFKTSAEIGLESPLEIDVTTGPGSGIDMYDHFDNQVAFSSTVAGVGVSYANQTNYHAFGLSYTIPDLGFGAMEAGYTCEVYNPEINLFNDNDDRVVKTIITSSFSPSKQLGFDITIGWHNTATLAGKNTGIQVKTSIGDIFNTGTKYIVNFIKTGSGYIVNTDNEVPYRMVFDNHLAIVNTGALGLTPEVNSIFVYEFGLVQAISDDTSFTALINIRGQGSRTEYTTYNLQYAKALACPNLLDTNIDTPVQWTITYAYTADNENSDLSTDYIRSGLVFNF